MEWLKNQWALAKTGEKAARRKLLVVAAILTICTALLISGQTSTQPIKIAAKPKTNVQSQAGYIHISGAVKHPGVYPIFSGMRLFEAVGLAGGFSSKADRDSVNLARLVTDGEQVIVARAGGASLDDGLIHLNAAKAEDFDQLPGIGPTLSKRIIDWRTANGGFKSIDDLRKVGGIGDKLFAGIKDLVSL